MTENDLHFSKTSEAQQVPLVALRRVSRFFSPTNHALFDMSLDVYPGEFIYLAGPSGAGKSTLLKVIHLSETPDTGNIYFSGHDVFDLHSGALAVLRRSIGFVFQDFKLVPYLSVASNLALPLEIAGMRPAHIRAEMTRMLSRIGLTGRGDDKAETLSGGEQQRVAVARALIGKPDLILADEPTGALDPYSAEYVFELLEEAAHGGTAVIFATHDRMLISARPHRYVAIDRGRIIGASGAEGPILSRRQRQSKDPIKQTSTNWRIA